MNNYQQVLKDTIAQLREELKGKNKELAELRILAIELDENFDIEQDETIESRELDIRLKTGYEE